MILKTNSEVGTPKCIQFPEGWIVKPLQELTHCSFGGGTPSTTNPCFWNGPIPWITTAIINSEDVFLKRFQRGITQKALDSTSTQLAPKGSVLIGTRVGVGKVAVTTFDVAINQDLTAFVLKEKVDAEFLAYCMKQQAVQSWFEENKRGTTIKGVARNTILNLMIPLPSFPEQRAIARALRAVQGAREARQREVALEMERKAALMEHLFTHGTRGEATKQTEIGEMPESWNIGKLGDFIKFKSGESRPKNIVLKSEADKRVPVYGGNGIMGYTNNIFSKKRHLIIGRVGEYCGCIHISETPNWITDNALYSEKWLDNRFGFDFAATYLTYLNLNQFKRKAGQPLLTQGVLKEIKMLLPSIEEQNLISTILRSCDSKIAHLEQEARLLQELFQAMLEELMSGRLPSTELAESSSE